jgi:riboflavin kinase / FMN adenylyltransferase
VKVVRFPSDERPARWHQPVVALGNFDGLHRGHMKIIDRVRRRAAERGGTSVVMTFDPHPPRVVRPDKAPALIMTIEQKLEAFERAGMQGVAIVEFTRDMSLWAPDRFVQTVLVDWLRANEVWVGANFLFGHDRAGNFSLLRTLGEQHDFPRRKDRRRPLQGLRRLEHPRAPPDRRRARRRGGGAAWASSFRGWRRRRG